MFFCENTHKEIHGKNYSTMFFSMLTKIDYFLINKDKFSESDSFTLYNSIFFHYKQIIRRKNNKSLIIGYFISFFHKLYSR